MATNYFIKSSKFFALVLILFFIRINSAVCEEKPAVFVPTGEDRQSLNVQLYYLDDPNEKYTLEQVASGQAGTFRPLQKQNRGFGYKGAMWIRFTLDLSKHQEPEFILSQNYEHVLNLKLFYPISPNRYGTLELAEPEPVSKRMFVVHNYLFKVPTPKTETTYYMRYAPGNHTLIVDLSWSSVKGAVEHIHNTQLFIGLFMGGLSAMFFFNLVICVYLRSRVYFYYIYYLGCMIGTIVFLNGFVPLIVQISQFYERLFALFAYGMIHAMTLFTRQLLSLSTSVQWLDKILRVIQWCWVFGGISVFFVKDQNPYLVLNYLILVTMPFLVVAGFVRLYQGYLPARLYCAGWVILVLSVTFYILVSTGMLPAKWMINNAIYGIQLASIWEAILFALALAYRMQLTSLEAASAKNAFLAMVSHELSTPLQRVVSTIDLMKVKGIDKTIGERDWQKLVGGVDHLEMQMKDLRDYARLGSGKMQLKNAPFNPREIILEISDTLSNLAKEKRLQYCEDIQVPNGVMNSDALRIQQITNNLCINAIKYTNTGHVTLRVRYDEKKPCLVIQVMDSGIGVEAKNIKKILEPFIQVDVSSTRKYGGLGMGLAIVQQLVKLLKGELYFDSELGKGTNVEVRIPVQITEDKNVIHENDKDEEPRVLLVDDTEDVRVDLKHLIESLGYPCDTAANGNEAVKLCSQRRYSVTLLDINMPEMDGFSTARAIKQSKFNSNTPLVWISGNDPKSGTPEQRKLFTHFLEKPVRMEKLKVVLKELIYSNEK